MDPAFVSRFRGQPGAAAPVRAGLQPGQLPAAGGAAPIGASLDIDDAAGETDQDRGKGGAPFPENRLPDGGGGGAARVVPGDSGRDWAVAIGSRVARMKADHGKNTSQQRRRCLHIREKNGIRAKIGNETPPLPEQNRSEPGKKACKSEQEEDNHENGKKQFIYAMNIKSNGKSRLKCAPTKKSTELHGETRNGVAELAYHFRVMDQAPTVLLLGAGASCR